MRIFEFSCWRCGKAVEHLMEPKERVFCESCFIEHRAERKEITMKYAELKFEVMYEQALRYLEKAYANPIGVGTYLYEYEKSAKRIYAKGKAKIDKFLSSHEIIAGIMLEDLNYEYETNKTVGSYRVDFYVPELNVCLEIDGHLHKHRRVYDNKRDISIRGNLGKKWEVVRIGTKFIESTPTILVDEIERVYKKKQWLRSKNNGVIPIGFSKREEEHYKEIFKDVEK